jgi:hypothetical protein
MARRIIHVQRYKGGAGVARGSAAWLVGAASARVRPVGACARALATIRVPAEHFLQRPLHDRGGAGIHDRAGRLGHRGDYTLLGVATAFPLFLASENVNGADIGDDVVVKNKSKDA